MTRPKVSIVILNWNGLRDTVGCLESLRRITYTDFETLVVDNGSTGDDVRTLRDRFGDFIHTIENRTNYGFAEGCNIGMRHALGTSHPDYMLLLNNDTVVDPELLSALVNSCESDPSIGIAGPKVYYHHDPNVIQSIGGRINWWNGEASLLGTHEVDHGQFDRLSEVDWVSGCALLARTNMIKDIGMLYAPYFAYFEEVDWCVRCKRAGYRIVCVPEARVWHRNPMSLEATPRSLDYMYYMTRNRILFMKRNAPALQSAAFLAQLIIRRAPAFTASALLTNRHNRKLIGPFFRGIRDGFLLMLPGKSRDGARES